MKRVLILTFLIYGCVSSGFTALGQVSLIMNGSFEQNGEEIGDIASESPLYWCDVYVPTSSFEGWVGTIGAVHGDYALTFSTNSNDVVKGEIIKVSQEVFFESDIEQLSFQLQLSSGWPDFFPWDPNLRTFFVAIDNEIIWDSNDVEIGPSGGFFGPIEVNAVNFSSYLDNNPHTMSLGLKVNMTEEPLVEYYTDIDFIKFDKYCGGFGFLAGDLNQDCYVNLADFSELALQWMDEPSKPKYDLIEDGIIDNGDLTVLTEDWLYNTDWTKWGEDGTVEMARLETDLDLSGEVDLPDLEIIAENWLGSSACDLPDIDRDGDFDITDYAILAGQWGMRDWIYYRD